jgi:hypothetical protein
MNQHIEKQVYFSRSLSKNEYKLLLNFCRTTLNIEISKEQLDYIGHIFCSREYLGYGRLAGDICDAILRGICASYLQIKKGGGDIFRYLEIGILHGLNFIGTYDVIRHIYQSIHFVAIDPFSGYYDDIIDPITRCPITYKLFIDNLDLFHIPLSNIQIFKGMSQEQHIKQELVNKTFDMIFIDGDHSYNGMKEDYEFYTPLLDYGGLLVVDNYHDRDYPDVTRAVDDMLRDSAEYKQLGNVIGRTIIIQKI